MMLLEDAELPSGSSSDPFPIPLRDPSVKWLNLVVPLFIYTLVMVALMWVLYQCFVYLNARSAHDEKRKLEKQQQVKMPLLSPPISPLPTMDNQATEMAPVRNPPLIQRAQSDRYANRAIRRSDASLQNMTSAAGEKAATSPPELSVTEGVVSTKNGTRISFSDTVAISAEPNPNKIAQRRINDDN
ncbi:hypothetical protein DdX_00147 [Ditylenchus destructor]|uniref:Uncharacterized protein n=1 Tax=Ditylenchus destructor TaxID=166010 RepID=A0AAD4RA45_9BILA|nr:hypothetical protein DdX_00147 [Ditylenchus destructor]